MTFHFATPRRSYRMTFLSLVIISVACTCICASAASSFVGSDTDGETPPTLRSFPLIPHHVHKKRRGRLLQEVDNEVDEMVQQEEDHRPPMMSTTKASSRAFNHRHQNEPIYQDGPQIVGALYQGYGMHYVDLWCGTPPQRQTLAVDTGTGITAFPCIGCDNCGAPTYHIDKLYDYNQSSTFYKSTCTMDEDNDDIRRDGNDGCKLSQAVCGTGDGYRNDPDGGNPQCKITTEQWSDEALSLAFEAMDRCYIGGPHEKPLNKVAAAGTDIDAMNPNHASDFAFDLIFGCQLRLGSLFRYQLADGTLGMNQGSNSFWNQMYSVFGNMGDTDSDTINKNNNNNNSNRRFSLCFSRQPTAERNGTEAGALTLGGTDLRLHKTRMVYSTSKSPSPIPDQGKQNSHRNRDDDLYFRVKVRKIFLRDSSAGESVQSLHEDPLEGVVQVNISDDRLNNDNVIVNSGWTDSYWNRYIHDAFVELFGEMTGREYGNSDMQISHDEMMSFPTIIFQLEGDVLRNSFFHNESPNDVPGLAGTVFDPDHPHDVILALPPSHYMEYIESRDVYTPRFYTTEHGDSSLGANALMGHDVFFDMDRQVIGWAESDCDYTELVTSNGYDFTINGQLRESDHIADVERKGEESEEDGVIFEDFTIFGKIQLYFVWIVMVLLVMLMLIYAANVLRYCNCHSSANEYFPRWHYPPYGYHRQDNNNDKKADDGVNHRMTSHQDEKEMIDLKYFTYKDDPDASPSTLMG